MSTGEIAYLALALTAFATFISVVGFISVWSRRPSPKQQQEMAAAAQEPAPWESSVGYMVARTVVTDRAA